MPADLLPLDAKKADAFFHQTEEQSSLELRWRWHGSHVRMVGGIRFKKADGRFDIVRRVWEAPDVKMCLDAAVPDALMEIARLSKT